MSVRPFPPEGDPWSPCVHFVLCADIIVIWKMEDPFPGFSTFLEGALTDLRGHWRCQD